MIASFCFVVSVQIPASRIVAAIFLELAFTAEIRVMLSQQSAPGMSVDINITDNVKNAMSSGVFLTNLVVFDIVV